MSKIEWKSEKRLLKDLIPAPYNPRQLTEKQAKDLNQSLTKFNLADPVVINSNNTIIGGHQRINILKTQGVEEVDVRVPDKILTAEEERELNLRLNKNLGEWDFDMLANFDEDMLKDVGFDSKELDNIFQLDTKPEDDVVPEARETAVKSGDMFKLGEHRLLCGDATKKEDVEKLMAGEKADMVFTDPPYGVGYEKKTKMLGNKDYTKIEGDNNLDEAQIVWQGAFENIGNILSEGGSYYICAPQGGDQMMMMMMKNHIPCKHELMWLKPSPVFSMGRLDYDYMHEPILYGWKGSHEFIGAGEFTKSVWEVGRDKGKLHPTMKPVALVSNAIMNSSDRDNLIIDLFGGSGSTLIACEKLNRKCRMMEIDPIYCQVIIDRWEQYAEKKAEKKQ